MPIEEQGAELEAPEVQKSTPVSEPVETSSRGDPGQSVKDKKRSKLNETLRAEFDKAKHDPSPARQAAAAQRAREENTGKFASENKDAPQDRPAKVERPEKTVPEPAQVPTKAATSESAKVPQASAGAPAALSKEVKAIWDTLPDVVRNDIIKRESDTAKGVEQLQQRYRPIDEALSPYRPLLQQHGKTEGEAIRMLFGWHNALANPDPRAKAQAFQALAQSHGFDLSTLAPRATGQPQQQPTDPHDPRAAIQSMVQQALQGYMAPLDQRVSAWEQRMQQEQQAKVNSDIGEFSKGKPYFEKVRTAMGQIMSAGYATSLEDAYNKATWADPEIRAEMQAADNAKREADAKTAQEAQAAEAAKVEEERKRKEREALERARKANVSPRAGTPSGSVIPKSAAGRGKSVRQSVAEVWQEARRASS